MTNRRAKIAAGATVVGLAALGGAALGSNPDLPAPTGQMASSGGSAAVVTGASGAAVPTTQTVAVKSEVRPPIVTRASGAPGAAPVDD
ncbi:MAG TPA: hypothetical protein VFI17_14075 [Solirubrobacterales bacterium]|nr:hypothetical protein [Solirubrobacterales bacterium]